MSEAELTHTALQDLLCQNLHFTPDDSLANQQGRITPAQADYFMARSLRNNHMVKRYLSILGIAALTVGGGVLTLTGGLNIIALVIMGMSLLPGMLAIWLLFKLIHVPFHRKMSKHLREHDFERVQGEISVYRIGSKRLAVADSFVLSVGDRGFSLTFQQYNQLHDAIPRGLQAVAYYIPVSRWMILSVVLT